MNRKLRRPIITLWFMLFASSIMLLGIPPQSAWGYIAEIGGLAAYAYLATKAVVDIVNILIEQAMGPKP